MCEAVRVEPLLPGWRWCVSPWHSSSSLEQLSLYSCLLEGRVHPLHKGGGYDLSLEDVLE